MHIERVEVLIADHQARFNATPPLSPTSKPPPARTNGDGEMGMMDFLTTPDMNEFPNLGASTTRATFATSGPPRRNSVLLFDFVNTNQKKNITLRSNRESIYPVLMVTVLPSLQCSLLFLDALQVRYWWYCTAVHMIFGLPPLPEYHLHCPV